MDAAGISGKADKSGRAPRANAEFAKQYGDYLNSDEGKKATRDQKDAKYAELKKANPDFKVTDEARLKAASTIKQNRQNVAARFDPFQDTENLTDPLRDAEKLIPGAKKQLANIETLGSDMAGGIGNYEARKSARELRESIIAGSMTPTQTNDLNDLKEDITTEADPFSDWVSNTISTPSKQPKIKPEKQTEPIAKKEDGSDMSGILDLSKSQNFGMTALMGLREAGKWLSNGGIPKTLKKASELIKNDPLLKWHEAAIPPTTAKADKEREAASMW
jgi:hypothetical protein